MRRKPDMSGSRLELLSSVIGAWLSEVESEVVEAVAILSDSDSPNEWWAERIKRRLQDNGPPDISPVQTDDRAGTLMEIAFWSGWLKGELETLQRCRFAVGSASNVGGRQMSLPLIAPHVSPATVSTQGSRRLGVHRLAAERLMERMDSKNYLPGAELVSIHLCSVLERADPPAVESIERECLDALDMLASGGSAAPLVQLAFGSGTIAGMLLQERAASEGSGTRKGGMDETCRGD